MAYVQDDWKSLPSLTLNMGLRCEYMSPKYEQDNKLFNYDPVNNRLLAALRTSSKLPAGSPVHVNF